MNQSLFSNPVFKEAVADIEALGLKVSAHAAADAVPYAVIGGRSNARWWLVPLEKGNITASGLALFQPLLTSARFMKTLAVVLSRFGLTRLWAKNVIYISGESTLQQFFTEATPLSFAYFTGTDSPHRKLAVQVMDSAGNIKGYVKVSRNLAVQALLEHEANTLNHLKTLNLQTANIPNVLFSGAIGSACALVTDTLKTPTTKSVTKLQPIHVEFLQELAEKTKADVQHNPNWLVDSLRSRFNNLEARLTREWKARLEIAITTIEKHKHNLGQLVLVHGDFTPWNTFIADGKLYVFDWEYANYKSTVGHDMIHFLLACPELKKLTIKEQIANVLNRLCGFLSANREAAAIYFIAHLTSHAIQYAQREAENADVAHNWDKQHESAHLIDDLLTGYIK